MAQADVKITGICSAYFQAEENLSHWHYKVIPLQNQPWSPPNIQINYQKVTLQRKEVFLMLNHFQRSAAEVWANVAKYWLKLPLEFDCISQKALSAAAVFENIHNLLK